MHKALFVTIGSALLCVGCWATPRPKIDSFSGGSIVVTFEGELQDAMTVAQQYCSATARDAQYVNTITKGGNWLSSGKKQAIFNCVASGRSNSAPIIHNNYSTPNNTPNYSTPN